MLPELDAREARVIGCLIEKSIVTPDQYPMTLNALTSACNQKSSREPVMSLTPGEVQRTVRQLEEKHLVRTDENFRSRVEKYSQRFCNTRYSNLQFDDAQLALITLLLLRGPQTPGELRARSGRLHTFGENEAVVDALRTLVGRDPEPVVARLPRKSGRRDHEYVHLFSGAVDMDVPEEVPEPVARSRPAERVSVADLAARVERLEAELTELKEKLGEL